MAQHCASACEAWALADGCRDTRHEDNELRYSDKIRELLAQTPDGMTIRQIADHFRCHYDTIQRAMMNTWGVYIDRYTYSENGMLTKVFCVVDVPQDAPRPDVKRTHKPAEIRV